MNRKKNLNSVVQEIDRGSLLQKVLIEDNTTFMNCPSCNSAVSVPLNIFKEICIDGRLDFYFGSDFYLRGRGFAYCSIGCFSEYTED